MLTPADIKNVNFAKASRGTYKAQDVEDFIDEVYESYSQLYKENGELIKKLQMLADRVESYRQDEDSIRTALLAAQRTADSILKEANEKSEQLTKNSTEQAQKMLDDAKAQSEELLKESQEKSDTLLRTTTKQSTQIVDEAKKTSQKMLQNAKSEIVHEKRTLQRTQKEVSAFRARLMSLYKGHIELINSLPAVYEDDDEKHVEDRAAVKKEEKSEPDNAKYGNIELVEDTQPVEEAGAEEAGTEQVKPEAEQTVQEESAETTENKAVIPDELVPEEKNEDSQGRENPFGTLKFGDDYNVESDRDYYIEETKKKGFFRRNK